VIRSSLPREAVRATVERLREANERFAARFPGEPATRQPVHTVYGGAHLFRFDATSKLGAIALRTLDEHAPDEAALASVLSLPVVHGIRARVIEKLRREPVEDYRIDFEDGYGIRAWDEEDGHAVAAAHEVAKGLAAGTLPPVLGIRIKSLGEELRERSIRTLDVFLSTLSAETGGVLPPRFVTTLPKVAIPEQVRALVEILGALEAALELTPGALKIEIMVETTQAIVDAGGRIGLPLLLDAADGRCVGVHFGPYDYTASSDITASQQQLSHPAGDFARQMLKVAFARAGVFLSDGPTTVLPIPPHRASAKRALTELQRAENSAAIHRAWRLHYENVTRALAAGYYQGWDLHPAQLPARYAAVYAFFLSGLEEAAARLRNFVERAAQATLFGSHFDDAATGQGLLNYFVRAVGCGAIGEDDALAATGLTLDELRRRSFSAIVAGRRSRT
jgi:citrate lyase beta subunit